MSHHGVAYPISGGKVAEEVPSEQRMCPLARVHMFRTRVGARPLIGPGNELGQEQLVAQRIARELHQIVGKP